MEYQIDERTEDQQPELMMDKCPCGDPDCNTFIIAMLRPVIQPVDDSDELAAMVHVPKAYIPAMIAALKEHMPKKTKKAR